MKKHGRTRQSISSLKSAGSIDDATANPMKWNTPITSDDYEVNVVVDDGKGGTATDSCIFTVYPLPPLFKTMYYIVSESGEIEKDFAAYPGHLPYIGDSENNNPVRGFASFDITSLSSSTITDAKVKFHNPLTNGTPQSIIEKIRFEVVYWGEREIELGDYDLQGTFIGEFDSSHPNIGCVSDELKNKLQEAINAGETRFQVRIRHRGWLTNHDGIWDGWRYQDIKLWVDYYE